jgi:Fungalysin/Thermolysin Propeptide Motif./Fungalysin metallopeptidase (M36).
MKKPALLVGIFALVAFGISERSTQKVSSANARQTGFEMSNFDVRLTASRTANESGYIDAIARTKERFPDVVLERHPVFAVPEIISIGPGLGSNGLSGSPWDSKETTVLRFLALERDLFGLEAWQIDQLTKTADYTNPDGNLSYITFEQSIRGVPVFQGELTAAFARGNEMVRIVNNLVPNIDYRSLSTDFGDRKAALRQAASHVNEASMSDEAPDAKKFYFPLSDGKALPAWRVMVWTKEMAYYVVVSADDGSLLWRKQLTEFQTQSAQYSVYGNISSLARTADSPTPGTPGCPTPTCTEPPQTSRLPFTLIGNELTNTFNNLGWIPDGENRTIGNNAEAGIDRAAPNGIDPDGWAFGGPARNFVFAYNPAPGIPAPGEPPIPVPQTYPPSAFQQGSITNAFYAVNRWHDVTYHLGFNESSRNFQNDNFGRGGVGGDSISVEVQDISGSNAANFSTPADGGRARLQLFVWTGTTPARDGALDNQVIMHEATHGLTSRLHGNATGLSSNMARSMGEGWSDFFALALLAETNDDQCGVYPIGGYSTQGLVAGGANHYYGLRRFPFARRACVGSNGLPHNPVTFRYLNAGCDTLIGTTTTNPNSAFPRGPFGIAACDQIHNASEIWTSALWEVRGQLVERYSAEEGNQRALQYITDGMKLSPLNPTMLQARDSVLISAQVSDPYDVCSVWRGFAIRGMGFSASIQNAGSGANNTVVTEAFDIPIACRATPRADFDGDGRSDISVFRPNEGNWYLNRSTAGFTALNWGLPTDKPAPGDYDGDNKTDVAIFRATTDGSQPDLYILNSSNSTVSYRYWGTVGDVPVAEDYDGDGKSDAAIFRPSTGRFWILNSSDGSVHTSRPFVGTKTVSGDFDGDGRSDYGIFDNGQWFVAQSSDEFRSGRVSNWGLTTDKLVPADYDGDGRLDIAVYRPSNGVWYVQKSLGGIAYFQFGLADDVPVPADYDGDGRSDVAVFRDGMWYIDRTTGGIAIIPFGLISDQAIPNAYLPQ